MNKPLLRLHLGAHKTATTHFQHSLQSMKASLAQSHINYVDTPTCRRQLNRVRKLINYNPRFWFSTQQTRSALVRKTFFGAEGSEDRGGDCLNANRLYLRSEENMIGTLGDIFAAQLYPDLEKRLAFLSYLKPHFEMEFYFSIRSFSSVLVGAYATLLRLRPERAIKLKAQALSAIQAEQTISWLPIIDRLLATTQSPITLWTQDAYKSDSAAVVQAFVGEHDMIIPKLSPPLQTKTPSKAAILYAESLVASGKHKRKDWTELCDDIYERFPAKDSADRYTFFSQLQCARLDEQYAQDIRVLDDSYAQVSFVALN